MFPCALSAPRATQPLAKPEGGPEQSQWKVIFDDEGSKAWKKTQTKKNHCMKEVEVPRLDSAGVVHRVHGQKYSNMFFLHLKHIWEELYKKNWVEEQCMRVMVEVVDCCYWHQGLWTRCDIKVFEDTDEEAAFFFQ